MPQNHNLETQALDSSLVGSRFWQISPDLLGVLKVDGFFESANPAWTRLLGWSEDEVRSQSIFDLLHPDDRERTAGGFQHLQRGNPILRFENRYRGKDGNYRWFAWSAAPYGDAYYCCGHDITGEKDQAVALALREADLRIERQNSELREQFIAVLGHDLRNPVAAIGAGANLLLKTPLNDRATQLVGMMQASVARMTGLIDNVLDFARGRLGTGIQLSRSDTMLEPVLAHVVAELRAGAPDRMIETRFDLNRVVNCDGARVAQLLSNLVSNAIAHGDASAPIRVAASTRGESFELSVANRGEPISPATMSQLFQPFFRGQTRTSKQGLGLGLYIASEIARAHGGTLTVNSSAAETRFTLRIPLR